VALSVLRQWSLSPSEIHLTINEFENWEPKLFCRTDPTRRFPRGSRDVERTSGLKDVVANEVPQQEKYRMARPTSVLEKLRIVHARCRSLMPMGETIGFWVDHVEAGFAVVEMDVDNRHSNAMGATHGGMLFLLADTAAGLAYLALLTEGESGTTVEMKINFLRPVWQTRLRAEARIIQQGATLSLAECDVRDSNQRLVARATATMMRLTGRAAERRTTVYGEDLDAGHDS
jgi:uncharacterized protein (TIGR00369 family)